MVRQDLPDMVYRSDNEKYDAVVQEIEERHKKGQPILVGTTSVAKSERISRMLKKKGDQAQRLECGQSRSRGEHYRSGRPVQRGDDRHEHGRTRH